MTGSVNTPLLPAFPRLFRNAILAGFAYCVLSLSSALAVISPPPADGLGKSVGAISIPGNVGSADVKAAITKAFTAREWSIKSEGTDRVVGYLKHRSNEAQLTLIFDNQKIEMYCFGWQVNKKTGVQEKDELPTGWINNIKSDVTKFLNRTVTTK